MTTTSTCVDHGHYWTCFISDIHVQSEVQYEGMVLYSFGKSHWSIYVDMGVWVE